MEETENLTEDMNPWELAKNMSLTSSQSSSSGTKGSTILKKANNFSSVFSKASRPFQKASIGDGSPLDPIKKTDVHPGTTSTVKVKLEDLTTESAEEASLANGSRKINAVFSKASSSVPVLQMEQSKSGNMLDDTISIDVLNCSLPKTPNSPSGEARGTDSPSVEAQNTAVPAVKKVPVFGARKTQMTKGAIDKEDSSIPKKIPKFSSSVVRRVPPFASSHSTLSLHGNGGNKVAGSQLLKPSHQSHQRNGGTKDSQLETDSLKKSNEETPSEDKGKETMKKTLPEISSITNGSEAVKTDNSKLFSNRDKKENTKCHTSESNENGHAENPKSITPKRNPKQSIKASAKTKDEKDKVSKSTLLNKINEKKSCSARSKKKSESVSNIKLAFDDQKSKLSSSASEDLEKEESNICVDSPLDEESSSMGEGQCRKETDLEVPKNNKATECRSPLKCSKPQKQDLAVEIEKKNAEEVGNVSCNSDLKKEKKNILKTKCSPKKAEKWDRLFLGVISQAMSADVNSQDKKELEAKKRSLKKSQKLKPGIGKKKVWTNGVLGNDEDKENISPESMKLKSKRKPMKQISNMKKRLKSKSETVTNNRKLVQQQSPCSQESDTCDRTNSVIQSPGTLAYKKELVQIVERSYDSWVQCDSCSKWRKLPPNIDPASLPPKWTCEVNYNENQNTCSAAEEDWNKENVYVYNGFIVGSVVWARVAGTDWWPAMVDIDPDFQIHNWLDGSAKSVKYYHVTFFGDPVYRGWVLSKHVLKFRTTDTHERFLAVNQKDSSNKLSIKRAVQQAHKALNMNVAERKKKYTFYARYHGSIGKRRTNITRKECETNTLGPQENSSLTSPRDLCGHSQMDMIESKDKAQTTCKDPIADKVRSCENSKDPIAEKLRSSENGKDAIADKVRSCENGSEEIFKGKGSGKEQAASGELNAEAVDIHRKDEERSLLSEKDSIVNDQEKRDQNKDFNSDNSMKGTKQTEGNNSSSKPKIVQDTESVKPIKGSCRNTEESQLEESAGNKKVSAKFLNMEHKQVEFDNKEELSNNKDKNYEEESSLNNVIPEILSSDDELHETIDTIIKNLDMVQSQDVKKLPLIEDHLRDSREDETATPRNDAEKRAIKNGNSVTEDYKNKTGIYSPRKVFDPRSENNVSNSKTQKASKDSLNGCCTLESEDAFGADESGRRYSLKVSSILPAMSQRSSEVSQEIAIQYDQLNMNKRGY